MGMKAVVKGYVGEKVNGLLLHQLPSEEYKIINNVIIRDESGDTTQIDHVVVSVYGIFVIETKTYKGKIYGTDKAGQWTQYLGKNSYSFINPLHQNYKHVMVLQKMTGLEMDKFIPMIAFSGKADLRVNTQAHVVYFRNVVSTIRGYQMPRIDSEKVAYYAEWISKANNTGIVNQVRHVQNVKGNLAQKEALIDSGICPKCGGCLVRRSGKNGEFIGCSNYPKCRYTAVAGVVYPPNVRKTTRKTAKVDVVGIKKVYVTPPTSKAIEKELLQIKKDLGML